MKSHLPTLLLLPTLAVVISMTACQSQPVSIRFDNETLIFPITIKEAVDRYKLSFNAPGYYYRREKAREISINIVFNGSDYHDEHQPKEVLYDREVISYVFTYKGEIVQSDSVKLKVERLCNCKLTFIRVVATG